MYWREIEIFLICLWILEGMWISFICKTVFLLIINLLFFWLGDGNFLKNPFPKNSR